MYPSLYKAISLAVCRWSYYDDEKAAIMLDVCVCLAPLIAVARVARSLGEHVRFTYVVSSSRHVQPNKSFTSTELPNPILLGRHGSA
jgi:hypothetical protein